jgi:tRNA(Ile)-lysidine synthase TilS/MesJ
MNLLRTIKVLGLPSSFFLIVVYVAMSGGVDSSTTAALLTQKVNPPEMILVSNTTGLRFTRRVYEELDGR